MNDYGEYNGNTVHDMWVDYTYHEITGELSDWYGGRGGGHRQPRYRSDYKPAKSISRLINECKSRIGSHKANIANVEAEIERTRKSIENPAVNPRKKAQLQRLLDVNFPNLLASYRQKLEKDEAKLISLLIKREKERNVRTIGCCIFAILVSLFTLWKIYN